MWFPSWLRSLRSSLEAQRRTNRRRKKSHRRNQWPQFRLEILEDRTLLSPYLVTTTVDSGPGSLRDAITQVNADTSHTLYPSPSNSNVDEIDFNITAASDTGGGYNAGTGVATIAPQAYLAQINTAVFINGYTQPGASPNTLSVGDNAVLRVQLALNALPSGTQGLKLHANGSTIRGLVFNGVGSGVEAMSLNASDYVTPNNYRVEGNFIGTDVSGTSLKQARFLGPPTP
jgi:hypothetical protein